ncbi:tyrosine-protein phosphatase [Streptomyces sp. NPDC057543]|uniref:tyrosine-protein phosphatase n=1 Tax=Streptomyces sp. NPDC057543 TaxID=3346163 RepID=UPI0036B66F82
MHKFRDVGGYRGENDRPVRWGRLYRSAGRSTVVGMFVSTSLGSTARTESGSTA